MNSIQKNWHDIHKASRDLPARLADTITTFVGSWPFIIRIEAFPYGLLTMIVSLEAILLSTFIMISQNRQTERDHVQAQADYDTNVAAKNEIEELQSRLARIENEKLDQILKILQNK